jgi:adenosine deaminase
MLDLHTHLGGAVPSAVLWEVLCDSGIQTRFASFDELHAYLSVSAQDIRSLDDFLGRYFHATELIQSSPQAAATSAYQAVVKSYRRSGIQGIELRYNPLKRIRGGFHTLDAIIMGTIQGLQRASMHYPSVQTGVIFSMGKEQDIATNAEIVQAAIRFHSCGRMAGAWGVVGIDMAGPESLGKDHDEQWLRALAPHVEQARKAGLGITWHVGETQHTGPEGMMKVIEHLNPHRIGHGIELRKAQGKTRDRLVGMLRDNGICLELCPSVNKVTRSISDYSEIAELIRFLAREGLAFCLNTDNPYLIHTNIQREYELMAQALGDDAGLLAQAHQHAKAASFLKPKTQGHAYPCVW